LSSVDYHYRVTERILALKTALWCQPAREAQPISAPLFGKATLIPAIWDEGRCIDFAGFDGTLSEARDSRFEINASL
jgi:hypothetical protein